MARIRSPFRRLTATAALAAAAAAAVAGPAHALIHPIDRVPDVGVVQVTPTPVPTAPTDNLNKIVRATSVRAKSVSAVVRVPANVDVTNRIDVAVTFAGVKLSAQQYDAQHGNRFAHDYPALDNRRRGESVTVDYTEHKGRKKIAYSATFGITIEPMYTVVVSGMNFKLLTDCDWVGDSEPYVQWLDASGGQHYTHDLPSMSAGSSTTVPAGLFGGVFADVTAAQNLQVPNMTWGEHDTPIFNPEVIYFDVQPTNRAIPLGGTDTEDYDRNASNEDCRAHIHFTTASALEYVSEP